MMRYIWSHIARNLVMTLRLSHILSTSGLQAAPLAACPPAPNLPVKGEIVSAGDEGEVPIPEQLAAQGPRRARIWDLGTKLHCSIIGTCLSTIDLRDILRKLRVSGAAEASDHDLHCMAVVIAGERAGGAKFLQKALDRRHRGDIVRYSRAKEPATLLHLWDECLRQGNIPGAYWAVLTHQLTTEDVVKRVFGDVHMLSHLVGAANRADIRRLRELQQDNAALAAKIERQQRQLQQGFAERDAKISHLNELLTEQGCKLSKLPTLIEGSGDDGLNLVIDQLKTRLAREAARCERSELRARELTAKIDETERALQASWRECAVMREELDIIERQLTKLGRPHAEAAVQLSGLTVLYVGGRAHQIPRMKELIESAGARFLHHDGGIEHSSGLLPGLVGRADRVFFPTDCVSHDAATAIKRACRLTQKIYEPLRTASLTCLLSALLRNSLVPGGHASEQQADARV
jgi:hypothetical protein